MYHNLIIFTLNLVQGLSQVMLVLGFIYLCQHLFSLNQSNEIINNVFFKIHDFFGWKLIIHFYIGIIFEYGIAFFSSCVSDYFTIFGTFQTSLGVQFNSHCHCHASIFFWCFTYWPFCPIFSPHSGLKMEK